MPNGNIFKNPATSRQGEDAELPFRRTDYPDHLKPSDFTVGPLRRAVEIYDRGAAELNEDFKDHFTRKPHEIPHLEGIDDLREAQRFANANYGISPEQVKGEHPLVDEIVRNEAEPFELREFLAQNVDHEDPKRGHDRIRRAIIHNLHVPEHLRERLVQEGDDPKALHEVLREIIQRRPKASSAKQAQMLEIIDEFFEPRANDPDFKRSVFDPHRSAQELMQALYDPKLSSTEQKALYEKALYLTQSHGDPRMKELTKAFRPLDDEIGTGARQVQEGLAKVPPDVDLINAALAGKTRRKAGDPPEKGEIELMEGYSQRELGKGIKGSLEAAILKYNKPEQRQIQAGLIQALDHYENGFDPERTAKLLRQEAVKMEAGSGFWKNIGNKVLPESLMKTLSTTRGLFPTMTTLVGHYAPVDEWAKSAWNGTVSGASSAAEFVSDAVTKGQEFNSAHWIAKRRMLDQATEAVGEKAADIGIATWEGTKNTASAVGNTLKGPANFVTDNLWGAKYFSTSTDPISKTKDGPEQRHPGFVAMKHLLSGLNTKQAAEVKAAFEKLSLDQTVNKDYLDLDIYEARPKAELNTRLSEIQTRQIAESVYRDLKTEIEKSKKTPPVPPTSITELYKLAGSLRERMNGLDPEDAGRVLEYVKRNYVQDNFQRKETKRLETEAKPATPGAPSPAAIKFAQVPKMNIYGDRIDAKGKILAKDAAPVLENEWRYDIPAEADTSITELVGQAFKQQPALAISILSTQEGFDPNRVAGELLLGLTEKVPSFMKSNMKTKEELAALSDPEKRVYEQRLAEDQKTASELMRSATLGLDKNQLDKTMTSLEALVEVPNSFDEAVRKVLNREDKLELQQLAAGKNQKWDDPDALYTDGADPLTRSLKATNIVATDQTATRREQLMTTLHSASTAELSMRQNLMGPGKAADVVSSLGMGGGFDAALNLGLNPVREVNELQRIFQEGSESAAKELLTKARDTRRSQLLDNLFRTSTGQSIAERLQQEKAQGKFKDQAVFELTRDLFQPSVMGREMKEVFSDRNILQETRANLAWRLYRDEFQNSGIPEKAVTVAILFKDYHQVLEENGALTPAEEQSLKKLLLLNRILKNQGGPALEIIERH